MPATFTVKSSKTWRSKDHQFLSKTKSIRAYLRNLYGEYLFKWSKVLSRCMTSTLCTGILNQPTYFSIPMIPWNWEIWMSPRLLPEMAWILLKQELLITHHQKCGGMSHTILNQIFGRWDVSCMRWSPWSHHSKPLAWKVFSKEFVLERFSALPKAILKTFGQLSNWCWTLTPRSDLIPPRYWSHQ